jgi:hypothetical protein
MAPGAPTSPRDTRSGNRSVEWKDLLRLRPFEVATELGLSLPGVRTALNVEKGMELIGAEALPGRGNGRHQA